MDYEAIGRLIELGFATTIAAFLVYWLTNSLKRSVDANTKALLGVQLMQAELYRLLIQHDSQIRGVNPSAGADATEAHRTATTVYNQVLQRIDLMEKEITKALEKM